MIINEAERAFPATGLFVNKLKTSLCENTNYSFCLLRVNFENKN